MKNLIYCLTLLLTFISSAKIHNYEFDVLHNGKSLGVLQASKKIENTKITYTSSTNIAYHLLVSINVVYDYHVEYYNSDLKIAMAHVVVGDNDKTKVKTITEDNGYNYYSKGILEKTIPQPLNHSIIQLLFEEPVNITEVYAEGHGEYHDIQKIGTNSYLKTAPNGHKNTYYYENGALQKSDVDAGVIKFSIVRKN